MSSGNYDKHGYEHDFNCILHYLPVSYPTREKKHVQLRHTYLMKDLHFLSPKNKNWKRTWLVKSFSPHQEKMRERWKLDALTHWFWSFTWTLIHNLWNGNIHGHTTITNWAHHCLNSWKSASSTISMWGSLVFGLKICVCPPRVINSLNLVL